MKTGCFFLVYCCIALCSPAAIAGMDQLSASANLLLNKHGETQLVVRVTVPAGHMLYADQFHVEVPSQVIIRPLSLPPPRNKIDTITGDKKFVYDQSFSATYLVNNLTDDTLNVKIHYQGCDQTTCFLPTEKEFQIGLAGLPTFVILKPNK